MRALVCLWLVACWRDVPPPRDPQPEAAEPEPAPASRIVRDLPTPKPDPFGDLIVEFDDYVDQLCRCSDSNCATRVATDLQKWGEQMTPELRGLTPTPEQQKRLTEVSKRFSDCMLKAMQAGSGGTAPTP